MARSSRDTALWNIKLVSAFCGKVCHNFSRSFAFWQRTFMGRKFVYIVRAIARHCILFLCRWWSIMIIDTSFFLEMEASYQLIPAFVNLGLLSPSTKLCQSLPSSSLFLEYLKFYLIKCFKYNEFLIFGTTYWYFIELFVGFLDHMH